mgnify:CR=1 FL=1
MPINPEAVGLEGEPLRRAWNSKDALLYAIGVGADTEELAFTTENTKDTPQRVLPTTPSTRDFNSFCSTSFCSSYNGINIFVRNLFSKFFFLFPTF